jgi:hypothetical protein
VLGVVRDLVGYADQLSMVPPRSKMNESANRYSRKHRAKAPGESTGRKHQAKAPSESTKRKHQAKSPSESTKRNRQAKAPSEIAKRKHQAKTPSEKHQTKGTSAWLAQPMREISAQLESIAITLFVRDAQETRQRHMVSTYRSLPAASHGTYPPSQPVQLWRSE